MLQSLSFFPCQLIEMSFDKLIFDKLISEDLVLSANSPRGVDPLWIPGPENPPNSDSLINFKMAF